MEIVIKIPDEVYSDIQKGIIRKHIDKVYVAIANGTPLPKGQGRNKDKKTDNLPSCNNCVHNGEWSSTGNCIKCSCFDRYEKRGNK